MEGQISNHLTGHPDDGDWIAFLEKETGWLPALRLRLHLRRCRGCVQRLHDLQKQMETIAISSRSELSGIRRNLIEAIRDYETSAAGGSPQIVPELRKALEEYLGAQMAAQLAGPALDATNAREGYDNVDRTLRLLLGYKAAAGLKAKLLQESGR